MLKKLNIFPFVLVFSYKYVFICQNQREIQIIQEI